MYCKTISALSLGKIDKYEYFTQGEKQIKTVEDQGERQIKALEKGVEKHR